MAAVKKKASAHAAPATKTTKLTKAAPPPKPVFAVSGAITVHKLEDVNDALERMLPNLLHLEDAATRIVISDETTFNKGSLFVTMCDRELDQLNALYKAVHGPVWDYSKLIQATFKPMRERLEKIRTQANTAMTAFYRAEEARKRLEAEEARRKQEEQAQQIANEHRVAGREDVAEAVLEAAMSAPAPVAEVTLGQQRNAFGGHTQARKVWKGAVADKVELLKAIIDGKVPWVVIEFKQAELNTVARQIQAVGVVHGIKVTHDTDLSQRGG